MKHNWNDVDPKLSPGIYATSLCRRCGLMRRFEMDRRKWMYFVNGLYRLRGPVCAAKVPGPLDGPTFTWRDYNFKLEPNALLRPWWVVSVPDPHRLGGEMMTIHIGPRTQGDGAVDELLFQAIVSLTPQEEGLDPFELAHAVGTTPKLALDTAMVVAEGHAARIVTMLKVINDARPT